MTKDECWDWCNYDSQLLCMTMTDDFDTWWDPEHFDWGWCSWDLCVYLPHKFDVWWDPKKFTWNGDSIKNLFEHLSDKFDIWWDPNKIYLKYHIYLIIYLPHKIFTWFSSKDVDIINNYINNLEWEYD